MTNVPDKGEFRKRVLLRLWASPWTLLPVLTGLTSMLGVWAFGVENPGMWVFSSICCILAGLGIGLSRLILHGEDEAKKVVGDIRAEMESRREKEFDELEKMLMKDGDERTETYLRDLRVLTRQFLTVNQSMSEDSAKLDVYSSMEIAEKVGELFNQSVRSLRQSFDLWSTADRLKSPKARAPLLRTREQIVKDVGKSIEQLSRSLADLQNLGTGGGTYGTELTRIRGELDKQIGIAEHVRGEMTRLELEDTAVDRTEEFLKSGSEPDRGSDDNGSERKPRVRI